MAVPRSVVTWRPARGLHRQGAGPPPRIIVETGNAMLCWLDLKPIPGQPNALLVSVRKPRTASQFVIRIGYRYWRANLFRAPLTRPMFHPSYLAG